MIYFFAQLGSVVLQRQQLPAQVQILVTQALAQMHGLTNFFFEHGQRGVHRSTIVAKILMRQGLRVDIQCKFVAAARRYLKTPEGACRLASR